MNHTTDHTTHQPVIQTSIFPSTTPDSRAVELRTLLNRTELDLVSYLMEIPEHARVATALAVRRRTTSEAHRYNHAADLAQRMPELFEIFRGDGQYSVDHLDAIWLKVNRHSRALRAAGVQVPDALDAAVALGVLAWIRATKIGAISAIADVAEEVLCTVAPLVVEETEQDDAAAVSLTRRGTRHTLECGSEVVADSLWSSVSTAALDVRREIIEEQEDPESELPPSMHFCRGQVALGLFGARRDQLNVTVNLYGTAGGPGYVLGTGWVSPATMATLSGIARHVRSLPSAGEIPATGSYRFTTAQRSYIEGRDARCRFPGCVVAADDCEHDHLVNSPHTDPESDGPTSVENGICLCRTHHTLKTAGIWTPTSRDNAVTLDWTGPEGARATTVAAGPLSPVRNTEEQTG
ncbi:HNH endonuclease signature motif containing protein [Corynebacterium sp. AOP12-C2-36]|uniref:HNH endonuclease signature motif containing protein n=1 Tax=Corynebacterium sp. AOP12-C2-36 TaxID=3457723 RepID=UPI0040342F81